MHTRLLPILAYVLLLVAASMSYSQDAFKPSADWPESSPVFQADVDLAGTHQYTNYREPVVVRTKSGRLICVRRWRPDVARKEERSAGLLWLLRADPVGRGNDRTVLCSQSLPRRSLGRLAGEACWNLDPQ
jgi:hypothetical protein